MYGYRRKSGSVKALKWLGMILLILGLMVFIFSLVLFAVNFNNVPKGASITIVVLPGFIAGIFAIGAGVASTTMSEYEGQIHNISSKNTGIGLYVASIFSALVYMAIVGTYYFYGAKTVALSSQSSSNKAEFGIFLVIFIMSFFIFVVSIILTVIAAMWIPREHDGPSPYSSEKNIIDEPYVVREERLPYKPGMYSRKYAASDGFFGRGGLRY